jgi:hypothetical protein
LIAAYRALGGGWQIRLGGEAAVPLSEPVDAPDLEEIPTPGDQGHDIQIPSLITQSTLLNPRSNEGVVLTTASVARTDPIQLLGTTE